MNHHPYPLLICIYLAGLVTTGVVTLEARTDPRSSALRDEWRRSLGRRVAIVALASVLLVIWPIVGLWGFVQGVRRSIAKRRS